MPAPAPAPVPPPPRNTFKPAPAPAPAPVAASTSGIPKKPSSPIRIPKYTIPTCSDLAIVLVYFNPTGSFRILQNALFVTNTLEAAKIPYFLIEQATGATPFAFPERPTIFQYRTSSFMFYKENLFAAAEPRIPASFTKLMLLDADILFGDPGWYDRVSIALDDAPVIQPFGTAWWLHVNFAPGVFKNSCFYPGSGEKHTGFAWAFQRTWYSDVGIFEYALIGGGDTILFSRLIGRALSDAQASYRADYVAMPTIPSRTAESFLDIEIFHLFHGTLSSRQYGSRGRDLWTALQAHGITRISDAVQRREDGVFEWLPKYRDAMNATMLRYFQGRKDDAL